MICAAFIAFCNIDIIANDTVSYSEILPPPRATGTQCSHVGMSEKCAYAYKKLALYESWQQIVSACIILHGLWLKKNAVNMHFCYLSEKTPSLKMCFI